jgi:transcriptional regulator with XRE-family HTH domain
LPEFDPRVGGQIRRRREEAGLSLSKLAELAEVSKSYLWSLENADRAEIKRRPSGQTLYRIAETLGVTMSDLLGRKLLIGPPSHIPPELEEFAREAKLPQTDLEMLAAINFRGEQPRDKDSWAFVYRAIRSSVGDHY